MMEIFVATNDVNLCKEYETDVGNTIGVPN